MVFAGTERFGFPSRDTNIETLERTHRWIPIELPPEPEYFHPSVDFKNPENSEGFLMANTELTKFDALKGKIAVFIDPLKGLLVRDRAEQAAAAGALVTVKGLAKEIEALRVAATVPLNDRVKAINALAKEVTAPLDLAEARIKQTIQAFVSAENARLAEERRKADEAAAADRRRLEEERRRQEEESAAKAKAERERQAEEERRRLRIAEEERLARASFGVETNEELEAKAQEAERLAAKLRADEINRRLDKERQDNLDRIKREADAAEAKRKAEEKRLAAQRPSNTTTVWKFEVSDWREVPQEYWMIDETKLGKAVRGGLREIPGVKIWSEQAVVAR
jgi:hypothetical protein